MKLADQATPDAFTSFGALLRYLRVRAHLSQRDLAIALGYSEAHISRLEQGHRRPDVDVVRARLITALELEGGSPWAVRLLTLAAPPLALAPDFPPVVPKSVPASPAPIPGGLLATKLYRPTPRTRQVPRPRLVAQFAELITVPLTVVIAPAGFGKTMLLADWFQEAQRDEREARGANGQPLRTAFLALDESDNDRVGFVRYLVAAIQQAAPTVGAGTIALLEAPGVPAALLLQPLLNDLAALSGELILALDDYHTITSAPVHELIVALVERLPPHVHLVLASRENPPLPLSRLRSRGQLLELRATHLRFTTTETGRFLRETMGLAIGDQEIAALESRTEGWAVGLQLAGLMLKGQQNPVNFVANFAGSNSYVIDYLASEILNQLPDHLRQFLLRTAILGRMCGELCDALLGLEPAAPDSYSRLLLAELEQRNLFLVPLDDERRWFRYHHLFAEVLRVRLEEGIGAERVAELHRRASHWYAAQGLVGEALQHAFSARDMPRAADLLDQHVDRMIMESGPGAVTAQVARLPRAELETRPALALMFATALSYLDEFAESEALLQIVRQRLVDQAVTIAGPTLEHIEAIRSFNALMSEQPPSEVIAILEPLFNRGSLPRTPQMHNAALILGCAYAHKGEDDRALALWETWHQICQQDGDGLLETNIATHICRVLTYQGRLYEAEVLMQQLLQRAAAPALHGIPAVGYAQTLLASLAYIQNRLETTIELGTAAIKTFQLWSMPRIQLHAYVPLALAHQALGNPEQANTLIGQALAVIERGSLKQTFTPVAAYQARLWIAQGNIAAAAHWATAWEQAFQTELDPMYTVEALTLCRLWLAQNRLDAADELLARCVALAQRLGRRTYELEGQVFQALVAHQRGAAITAREHIAAALALAATTGVIRPFLDAGAPMAALLADAHAIAPATCASLLAAFPAP
jgi:LuxR family transcriptional regulator, maltose regulon positive regulatory protein